MDPIYYLIIALGVAFVGYVTLYTIKVVKHKKQKKAREAEEQNLEVKDDVRYTNETNTIQEVDETTTAVPVAQPTSGKGVTFPANSEVSQYAVNATYQKNDIILKHNVPVVVSQNGQVKPGKYILLSTSESINSFHLRVGIYVREYKHNQEIVLSEGDAICAVSGDVILR